MLDKVKWIWSHMDRQFRVYHILALCISVFSALLLLINPALTQQLIDQVFIDGKIELLSRLLIVMFVVKLFREGLRYFMVVSFERSSQNVMYNLRCTLFEKLQYSDINYFEQHQAGDLMTRLTSDLDWCRHFVSYINYRIVDSTSTFLFATGYLFFVNWKLSLALLCVTPVLVLTTKLFSKKIRPLFVAMREKLSELNTTAQENIAANRVVKAFAREEFEKTRFAKKNQAFMDSNLKINKLWLSFSPIFELLAHTMGFITIFLGAYFIIQGEMTPGEVAIFASLSWAIAAPMRELSNMLNELERFSTSANKVMELSRDLAENKEQGEWLEHNKMIGKVEFRNVTFRHNNKTLIRNVSFTVEPGQTVAIMGPTGSGKTTLVQLLARFYEIDEGQILVDDCDIRQWKLSQLRRGIGTATQDVFLFSDTVEGNVAFGNQSLEMKEIEDFASRAAAKEFIEHLPEGYDTIIGERGVGLSGGQRQRLALARALAVRPSILIMDDTTSALDSETESYIQGQLRALPFDCTKFIIAQRISSMRDADLILVLINGQIAERGTHEELLAKGHGYYWQTYMLQSGQEERR